jgi:hypothetical protein
MKMSKFVRGLCLTILVAFGGGNVALAKSPAASPTNPTSNGDPVQTHNKQNKGLKSPHSARKAAAKRLKVEHQQEHQQKLQNWAKAHHGYTGLGQAGNSHSKIPSKNGGA